MKIEQISEHIWSLKLWMILSIHVWVVVEEDGLTLVDAGIPLMAKGILKLLDRLNAGPLQRILLTHGHVDHVGAIKQIVSNESIPVYAHQIEIPYLEGELTYPRRKKAEFNVAKGVTQPLAMDAAGKLAKVGSLQPYFTPGHSPGHVVYYHEQDQVLLAGDLFNSRNGKLRSPMFTPDRAEALRSSTILRQLNPKRVEVCHGEPVLNPLDQLDEYIHTTQLKYGLTEGISV